MTVPAPDPAVKALENLLAAMQTLNDTTRKLADSIRILDNRVVRLERDQPERNIA